MIIQVFQEKQNQFSEPLVPVDPVFEELVSEISGDVISDNVLVRPLFVDVSVFIIIKKYNKNPLFGKVEQNLLFGKVEQNLLFGKVEQNLLFGKVEQNNPKD